MGIDYLRGMINGLSRGYVGTVFLISLSFVIDVLLLSQTTRDFVFGAIFSFLVLVVLYLIFKYSFQARIALRHKYSELESFEKIKKSYENERDRRRRTLLRELKTINEIQLDESEKTLMKKSLVRRNRSSPIEIGEFKLARKKVLERLRADIVLVDRKIRLTLKMLEMGKIGPEEAGLIVKDSRRIKNSLLHKKSSIIKEYRAMQSKTAPPTSGNSVSGSSLSDFYADPYKLYGKVRYIILKKENGGVLGYYEKLIMGCSKVIVFLSYLAIYLVVLIFILVVSLSIFDRFL